MNLADMLDDYLSEARNTLSKLEQLSYKLQDEPELLKEAMRLFHTLKGASGFMEFNAITEICHKTEDLLSASKEVLPGLPGFIRALSGVLSDIMDQIEETGSEPGDAAPRLAPFVEALETGNYDLVQDQGFSTQASLRLSPKALDDILAVMGQVEVLKNRLSANAHLMPHQLSRDFREMELQLTRLRDKVMALRMVDMGRYFNAMRAVVSEAAAQLSKEVRFESSGADVKVDRVIAEGIMEAITHLLRNAVDHGIEPPHQREKLGKDPVGTVRVSVSTAGNSFVVEISDDGRGVDVDKLRARARELLGRQASWEELTNLLFVHGFSLKDDVGKYSGRGVGLDVVRQAAESLGGAVFFDSQPGQGTTVSLELPISVMVTPMVFLRVGNQEFGLPLSSVIRVDWRQDLNLIQPGSKPFVKMENKNLPLVDAGRITHQSCAGDMIITLRSGPSEFCLAVDEVLPERDAVVNPLSPMLQGLEGFSGAVIGPDGVPVLVLDPPAMARMVEDA